MAAGRFFRARPNPRPAPPSAAEATYVDLCARYPALAALFDEAVAIREQRLFDAWHGTNADTDPGLRSRVRAMFPPRTRPHPEGGTITVTNADASTAERLLLDALKARGLFAPIPRKPPPRVHVSAERIRERRARRNDRSRDRARLRRLRRQQQQTGIGEIGNATLT
jgi:hypothetical protein